MALLKGECFESEGKEEKGRVPKKHEMSELLFLQIYSKIDLKSE